MEAGFSTGALLPPFRVPGLRVAAKTGTGEFAGDVNAQGELPTHGWITGFAPADDPQISVTVFVDRGSGSKDAAPIAMRILRHYFNIPDDAPAPPVPGVAVGTPSPAPTGQPVQPSAPPRALQTGPAQAGQPPAPTPTPEVEPTPEPGATRGPRPTRAPAPAPAAPSQPAPIPAATQAPTAALPPASQAPRPTVPPVPTPRPQPPPRNPEPTAPP
jgi:hypothetical protein